MKKVLLFEQKIQFCHNAQKWERYIWQSDETSTGWGVGTELQKLILYNRMRLCYDGYIYEKKRSAARKGRKGVGRSEG